MVASARKWPNYAKMIGREDRL